MGSPAGIQQHIAELHIHNPELIYVVRRYVANMMDEEGITMFEASGALHHVLHMKAQREGYDAHDPNLPATLTGGSQVV